MNKLVYSLSILAILVLSVTVSVGVSAQEKAASTPIFITPYSPTVPTYESRVPTMVKNVNPSRRIGGRTYTQPNRKSGPVYYKAENQFAEGYGRVRGEKDFYDEQTATFYDQYDYMGLLAQRGDTAKLREVVADVQKNGVFDPAKFQTVMTQAQGGGSAGNPQDNGSLPSIGSDGRKRVYQVKQADGGDLPQKLHSGYDDEEQAAPAEPKRSYPQPIFLNPL